MDTGNLIKAVLTLVVGYLLKLLFTAIGYELDPVVFNSLVAAIVVWFLTFFSYNTSVLAVNRYQASRVKKEVKE